VCVAGQVVVASEVDRLCVWQARWWWPLRLIGCVCGRPGGGGL